MAVMIASVFGLADFGFNYFSTGLSMAFCCAALVFISIFICYYCRNDLAPIEDADVMDRSIHWSDRMSSLLKVARPLYVGFALAVTVYLLLVREGVASPSRSFPLPCS